MRQVVMLRGINVGTNRRVPMSLLREVLAEAGFGEVETYLQSGNAVLSSELGCEQLERQCASVLSQRLGFEVPTIARSAEELAAVVRSNPLADVAVEPKRYQVSFLSAELSEEKLAALAALATDAERLVAAGRELYAWHPDGIARSKLWNALAGPGLGVTATARNWRTVTALLAMARG